MYVCVYESVALAACGRVNFGGVIQLDEITILPVPLSLTYRAVGQFGPRPPIFLPRPAAVVHDSRLTMQTKSRSSHSHSGARSSVRMSQAIGKDKGRKSSSAGAPEGKAEWWNAGMVILGEVMGAGALGLPGGAVKLGWVLSIGACLFFGFCSSYTGLLLARCRVDLYEGEDAGGYGDLATKTYGPCFGAFTKFLIVLNWYLLLPYYLVTAASSMQLVAPDLEIFGFEICDWMWPAIMGVLVILPMQFTTLTELSALCGFSTAAIIAGIALIGVKLFMDGPVTADGSHGDSR